MSATYDCLVTCTPGGGRGAIHLVDMYVFLAAYRKLHDRSSSNVLCMLAVAVARSSSSGVAIRYVLPVLWMTPRFTKWPDGALCVFLSAWRLTTRFQPTTPARTQRELLTGGGGDVC